MDDPLTQTVGVILAGGAAQRMGGVVKPLLPLPPGTVFSWCHQRVHSQVQQVALSVHDAGAWGGDGAICRAFAFHGPILSDNTTAVQPHDRAGRIGPLAGFLSALRWAKDEGARWVALFPGDTPFIPRDLVVRLHQAAQLAGVLCAYGRSSGRDHPAAALLHVDLYPSLQQALNDGERRLGRWLCSHGAQTAEWTPAPLLGGDPDRPVDPFYNINTPEALRVAQQAVQSLAVHRPP
jgi:molybdopterin-guanine dinucleotide biosynthesis protein A